MDYTHCLRTGLVVLIIGLSLVNGDTYNVDMENSGVCSSDSPVAVGQYDIFNIYAEPPQDGKGVLSKCTVRFYSPDGQRFKLYVRDLQFRECQVYVRLYDGDRYLNTARYSFDCNSPAGNIVYSNNPEVALSLEKSDSTSTGYKFYFRLALESGPVIGGEEANIGQVGDTGLSTGALSGIVVACVLVVAVVIAVILYCLFVYRKKKEEKEIALSRSRSTLFGTSLKDVDSVHSSIHSTHSTHVSKDASRINYPAFRTKASISEKVANCNSIDTRSYDSDAVDHKENHRKPILVKNEFNAMKKGLEREERRQEREKADIRMQEKRWNETRQADKRSREESNKGLGRSNRGRENRLTLNEENIRRSSRADRHRDRSYDDYDDKFTRSSRGGGAGSTRTRDRSRAHSPARSGGAWSEPDYVSKHREHSRERDRGGERSQSGTRRRSNSSGHQSRRRRDYYEERDAYSDYDDGYRSSSRDRHNSYRSHRSGGTQRSRSHSNVSRSRR